MNRLCTAALQHVLPMKTGVILAVLLSSMHAGAFSPGELPEVRTNPVYKINSLFFTFDYLSQTNILGVVDASVKQPTYSSSLLFYSKHNFDIGVSGIILGNSDSSFTEASAELDFMAGYSFRLADDLVLYPSYTHIEYSRNTYTLQSLFTDIIQTDLYLDKKHYYGGFTASYFFGTKNMFFGSLQNAVGFEKEDFLIRNSYLSIQLEFDINFSDKNYYNEFIYFDWSADEFLYWVSENYPRTLAAVTDQISENGLENTKSRFYELLNTADPDVFEPAYAITSLDFMLPVYYSIGPFMFNFTAYFIIPTFSSTFYDQNPLFIFNAGVAYSLNF